MSIFPTIPTMAIGDVVAYREFMRPLLAPWIHQAWVAIVDPLQKVVVRDDITGAVTSVTIEPIWTGWSRVQPLRTALNVKKAVNSTTTRVIQFWVDFPVDQTIPDIRPGLEIVVMDGLNDPFLTEYEYLVTGSENSSMAWQRTIETVVNLEGRPNYDTSAWPQKPVV